MMKTAEIRHMSDEEIHSQIDDTRKELMNFRFQVVTGQLTDTSRLKKNSPSSCAIMKPCSMNANWQKRWKVKNE